MRERVFAVVSACIGDLNEELEYESLRNVTEATPLFGGADGVDSLSLVALVAALERELETAFDKRVVLTDERAMSMRNSPYRTAGALTDLIVERLGTNHE